MMGLCIIICLLLSLKQDKKFDNRLNYEKLGYCSFAFLSHTAQQKIIIYNNSHYIELCSTRHNTAIRQRRFTKFQYFSCIPIETKTLRLSNR